MTAKEKKLKAQDLIMYQLAGITYGEEYLDYCNNFKDEDEALECLRKQMDRVAKMFGFDSAWFC